MPDTPVTLINTFTVPLGRDDAFMAAWRETSGYFRGQPGFRSLRLHRALTPDTPYRFVNVAVWASARDCAAAHGTETFRSLVSQPRWQEFAARPAVYEVAVAADAESGGALD